MIWTTQRPQPPRHGEILYYWIRGGHIGQPMIVSLYFSARGRTGAGTRVFFDRASHSSALYDTWGFDGEWAGPITPPQ